MLAFGIQLCYIVEPLILRDRSIANKVALGRYEGYGRALTSLILIYGFDPVVQLLIARLLVYRIAEQDVRKFGLLTDQILRCHIACQVHKVELKRGLLVDHHNFRDLIDGIRPQRFHIILFLTIQQAIYKGSFANCNVSHDQDSRFEHLFLS